jgi:SAM-dependent methyltransferase
LSEWRSGLAELAIAPPQIDGQYSTRLSRDNIEQALIAAGKDLSHRSSSLAQATGRFGRPDHSPSRDVAELPFAKAGFDVVISQHVQMNVTDKTLMYQQARRVLVTGGRLAVWDVTAGTSGNLDYPLPWADRPELSHLTSADQLRVVIEAAGFAVVQWNDLTEDAAAFMEVLPSAPVGPLGLHTFIHNLAQKAKNLTRGLSGETLRVIQGVSQATDLERSRPQ